MSYTLTLKDIDPLMKASATPPKNYTLTLKDIQGLQPPPPQHHSSLYNLGAGFLNPFINMLNLLPEGVTAGMHALGAKRFQDPLIKTFPSEGGLAYDVGNVAGFAVPFGDIAGGVEGASALARGIPGIGRGLKALARVPGGTLAGRTAQTAIAGGLTGAATTSPTTGRETGAIGGTIGAGLGGLGSQVLGRLASPFAMKGRKIAAAAIDPVHRFFNESIGRIMDKPSGDTLKDAYTGIKKQVDWDSLKPLAKEASKAGKIDYGTYQNEFDKILEEARTQARQDPDVGTGLVGKLRKLSMEKKVDVPPEEQKILLPGQLITKGGVASRGYAVSPPKELPPEVKKLRPMGSYNDVVDIKKNINNLANWDKSSRDTENRLARLYSGRLGTAIDRMVRENGVKGGDAVTKFSNEWENQRKIYGRLQQFYSDPVTGKFSQSLKNELDAGNYEKSVKRFVPGAQESGDKLARFSNLIGDRPTAEKAILQKALEPYTDKNKNIDTSKLAAGVNKKRLSPVIGQLFNEPEKRALSQIINSEGISKDMIRHPGVLSRLSRHPFFTAGTLGTIAHVGRLPMEMAAALGGVGFVGPQMVQQRLMGAAERKAADLIERGEWDKLEGLGKSIKRESLPTKKFFPSITGGLGRQVAVGGQTQ